MVAVTLWALCDAVESALTSLPSKILVSKISHIGIQSVPVLFLIFVLHYTRRERWLSPQRVAALWIIPVIAVVMVFANEWHYLIWQSIEIRQLPTDQTRFTCTAHFSGSLLSTLTS